MRMKQKEILSLNIYQLKELFIEQHPKIIEFARESSDNEDFKRKLYSYIINHPNRESDVAKNILSLIKNDGLSIYELSKEKNIKIETISTLRHVIIEEFADNINEDFILDLYFQFSLLEAPLKEIPSKKEVEQWMKRWPSSLEKEVLQIRGKNIDRIIKSLIDRIDNRHSQMSRFVFPENISYQEKYKLVEEWWKDWRFHFTFAIKSPNKLNRALGYSLSTETIQTIYEAKKKGIPFFVTPYYLSLINIEDNGYDDESIRSYVLYSQNLVDAFGEIKAWEKEDVVETGKPNAAGWLLPAGNNIHRRYPDVAILIPDSMGRACGGLCASCQRMYDFQSKRLNFDFETLKPHETWNNKLKKLMDYFEKDSQIRDILITGGDALMSQNKTLRNILEAVYKMALRKQKANLKRNDGEKYAELQRVRLGSRLPAYMPMKINDELIDILRDFKQKASAIGVKQFVLQTHFQSPIEITSEAKKAIEMILSAGWIVTNQLVYNVASSRRGHTAQLRKSLNNIGVLCYYTFTVKGFEENYAVFVPNSRSIQEQKEEKILGEMTPLQKEVLCDIFEKNGDKKKEIKDFLDKSKLPFLATDRNVLNLPGIGKSMSFVVVGIDSQGKRILQFDHDRGRLHSHVIDEMEDVFIVESKSIGAYLRQLEQLGENSEEYASIWYYTSGMTEPRFKLYEYPEYDFDITKWYSNVI